MARIFISYSRADGGTIADRIADRLRVLEHEVFLDVESIRAGTLWKTELQRRIAWSDVVVIIVTTKSNDSDYVYEEIKQAAESNKFILPVQIDNTPLPVWLRGTWQAIKVNNENIENVIGPPR